MRGGLISQDVGREAAADQLGQHVGRVPPQADRPGHALAPAGVHPGEGLVEAVGRFVQIAGLEPAGDPRGIDLDHERDAA
ncbi:MAG TPA: hypothetical protein VND92_11845, partial [Vicinamibacterales bacterium]|nr:hypothetical protein [Vicinamibacterales bacterium]